MAQTPVTLRRVVILLNALEFALQTAGLLYPYICLVRKPGMDYANHFLLWIGKMKERR